MSPGRLVSLWDGGEWAVEAEVQQTGSSMVEQSTQPGGCCPVLSPGLPSSAPSAQQKVTKVTTVSSLHAWMENHRQPWLQRRGARRGSPVHQGCTCSCPGQ